MRAKQRRRYQEESQNGAADESSERTEGASESNDTADSS
jgi:hypothetical protein